ncbi:MAG: hypothetical protein QM699_05530 [Amaricoccus sp.]|uniref:hypothetical protein n=1 Tax=Amaricoccus sp. TaxID=1872485 RepID=UPI0039E21E1F
MRRLLLGLVTALAACAPGGGDASLPAIRPGPVKGATLPPAQGEAELVVRAVQASAPEQDIAGATCTAASPYFTATFVPPARLLVPDFGSAAPTVTVTCKAGSAQGSALVAPEAVWSGGAGGFPTVGISVGTGNMSGVGVGVGWWGGGGAGMNAGHPVTRYPAVRIPLQ